MTATVRLAVNLHVTTAHALRGTARRLGITNTEAIRRAIGLWQLVEDARADGHRIWITDNDGTVEEIVLGHAEDGNA